MIEDVLLSRLFAGLESGAGASCRCRCKWRKLKLEKVLRMEIYSPTWSFAPYLHGIANETPDCVAKLLPPWHPLSEPLQI